MTAELRLPVLALPGLSPDSLGNYLASLGLLRVLSRKWPEHAHSVGVTKSCR